MIAEPAVIDVTDSSYWSDPHPHLREARERHALAKLALLDSWIVLRYADVEAAFKDSRLVQTSTEFFEAVGIAEGPLWEWWRHTPIAQNPPEHTRIRAHIGKAFTPRRSDLMRALTREIAAQIVADAVEAGGMDLVKDFADVIPVRVISAMLGVPADDHKQFAGWTKDLALALSPVITPEARVIVECALVSLYGYVTALLQERRTHPREDLLSALVAAEQDGARLSTEELNAMVIGLLFGGHDTTKSLLSIATWVLARHPEQLALLAEDPRARSEGAIEEILRWEPPVTATIRRAAEPLEIAGVTIHEGELVTLSMISANRDARRFREPDRLDVLRTERTHFTFGHGIHFCIGASLARAEAQEAIPILFGLFGGRYRLEIETEQPPWVPMTAIRLMEHLPVRFVAA
jgi:cytochrome P450